MTYLRKFAMWLVWNVPLGFLAPYVLGFALNSRPVRRRQTCWCLCPGCGKDLVSDPGPYTDDERGVHYTCSKCGTESWWNFDIYPVPVIIDGPGGLPRGTA